MANEIELEDLSATKTAQRTNDPLPRGPDITSNADDQTVTVWAYAATGLYVSKSSNITEITLTCFCGYSRLTALAIPMVFFPRVLLLASEATDGRNTLTSLESYLCLNSGILLLTFALALLFNVSDRAVFRCSSKLNYCRHHPINQSWKYGHGDPKDIRYSFP